MSNLIVEQFVDALQKLEQNGDIEPMVGLFTDDAEISNLATLTPAKGREGATRFWQDYLSSFQKVQTRFTRMLKTEETAMLEWSTDGALPSGRPLSYKGVTILDLKNGRISRFKAFYDSAVFVNQGAKHTGDSEPPIPEPRPMTTAEVMEGKGGRRDISTPGDGVLTSTINDRDAATG